MYVKDEVTWKTQVYKEDYSKTGLKDKICGVKTKVTCFRVWTRGGLEIWGCYKDVNEDPNLQGCYTSQHGGTSQKIDFQWYVVTNSG